MKSIYQRAVEAWGVQSQLGLVQEECAELIKDISKVTRGKKTIRDLAEETADVELMLGQLRFIIGDEAVDAQKQIKIARVERLLAEHKGPPRT